MKTENPFVIKGCGAPDVDRGEDGCRVYDRFFARWLRKENRVAVV